MEEILKPSKWMQGSGEHADIVISSRVRLARNLKEFNFNSALTIEQSQTLIERIIKAVHDSNLQERFEDIEIYQMQELDNMEKVALVEKHLISPHFVEDNYPKSLILSKDDEISIMVNEEDHLRIQAILPSMQLDEALQLANRVDDYLEEQLEYAFDEDFGYLTSCPTNVGTGLRASIMVHLPGLVFTNRVDKIFAALPKVGLTVRGLYGEGTKALGNLFQISNQVTLGQSEEEILENLKAVAEQIVEQEILARKALNADWNLEISDKVSRAYGILSYAKKISSDEALKLISDLRMGIDLKLIDNLNQKTLNYLMYLIQPAALQIQAGKNLEPQERDRQRAELISKKLKE